MHDFVSSCTKVGIILDDSEIYQKDLSKIHKGNPGIGGTQYCFLMLIHYLNIYSNELELIVYTYNKNTNNQYPIEDAVFISCATREGCIYQAKRDGIDILLINFTELKYINTLIAKEKIKTIVWVHNLINANTIKIIRDNDSLVRIVLLGRQHYDRYLDDDFIAKCVVIPNMVDIQECRQEVNKLPNNVTYTGALVESKGFHILAKSWKRVVERVPDAHLYIIGSGKLYNNKQKLGKHGIATEEYEEKFMKFLLNDGEILDSVHFMGLVGDEKKDIYLSTKVGVVNPSAKTEVCPISVLEMAAYGIPVISKKKNGVPDTIIDRQTGILIKRKKSLSDRISNLLLNDEENENMGINARKFVLQNRTPSTIIPQWIELIKECNRISILESTTFIYPENYYMNNFKWLKTINRIFRFKLKLRMLPSVIEVEYFFKRMIKRKGKL